MIGLQEELMAKILEEVQAIRNNTDAICSDIKDIQRHLAGLTRKVSDNDIKIIIKLQLFSWHLKLHTSCL